MWTRKMANCRSLWICEDTARVLFSPSCPSVKCGTKAQGKTGPVLNLYVKVDDIVYHGHESFTYDTKKQKLK